MSPASPGPNGSSKSRYHCFVCGSTPRGTRHAGVNVVHPEHAASSRATCGAGARRAAVGLLKGDHVGRRHQPAGRSREAARLMLCRRRVCPGATASTDRRGAGGRRDEDGSRRRSGCYRWRRRRARVEKAALPSGANVPNSDCRPRRLSAGAARRFDVGGESHGGYGL